MNKNQINDSSIAIEQRTIRKHFTEDEMIDLREKFSTNEILKSDAEEELAEVKKTAKAKIDGIKEISKDVRTKIKHKYIDVIKDVNCVPNFAEGVMEFYDTETGELVDTRKLRPNEKQMSILNSKTA